MYSDISPIEGRTVMDRWPEHCPQRGLNWEVRDFSIGGEFLKAGDSREQTAYIKGKIHPLNGARPVAGWIEMETVQGLNTVIEDLFLVGTRPLPQPDITCICRHPTHKDYFVAATKNSQLLLLDARLSANLEVLAQISLPAPLVSLVCCGSQLLGLVKSPQHALLIINTDAGNKLSPFKPASRTLLATPLTALAENDEGSAWGLGEDGSIYRLELFVQQVSAGHTPLMAENLAKKVGRLHGKRFITGSLTGHLKSMYKAIRGGQFTWRSICRARGIKGVFAGFAYDGSHFWAFRLTGKKESPTMLLLYDKDGSLNRGYTTWPEVSLSSLNYSHNQLLILDLEHQQLHIYHLADNMEPVAGWSPHSCRHPGYLAAGTPDSGGIRNLCLLYAGGEGSSRVHRYDLDKLRPLVGYVSTQGVVKDIFMDGFLLLAQYSPLLNGRSFGADLKGEPSRKEDWLALFDEYFYCGANLQALENCAAEVNRKLDSPAAELTKVVLAIPTADRRCTDWDDKGFSLAEESHRIEVTEWAMQELVNRWQGSRFRKLELVGFYYMTEQGAWNDPVLTAFPRLCRKFGVRSFAIPGITSSWMTEFTRAGFDCVAFQSSHSFWRPIGRPRQYLLKIAGRIAREFRMGMEVELPFDVMEPVGQAKLRDYLEMAGIQGWAGAFKAYFQSYNMIKNLAESDIPACRQLYDDLYHMSQLGRTKENHPTFIFRNAIPIDWQASLPGRAEKGLLRYNIEGHQGVFQITEICVK